MVRRTAAFLCAAALVALSSTITSASREDCEAAVDQYRSAVSDVADALRAYSSCIASARGRDDCSTEFATLQSAQDDFESAVSERENECE